MAEPVDSAHVRIAPFIHHSKDWHKAVNHELSASLLKEELQELDSVVAQAIFVHDHNLLDHAAQDAFQKGKKRFAFEVEATADVGEDAVVGIGSLEVCDLALQILFLVGATDASVDAPFRLCRAAWSTWTPRYL